MKKSNENTDNEKAETATTTKGFGYNIFATINLNKYVLFVFIV